MISDDNLINAVDDLRVRTLSHLPSEMARLVYLSSTRDYNTGSYSHDGLALRFTKPVAEMALEICHQELFERLAQINLEDLTLELEGFILSTKEDPMQVLKTWRTFEAYRVLIPRECSSIVADYFFSNIKFALPVLQIRLGQVSHPNRDASPLR